MRRSTSCTGIRSRTLRSRSYLRPASIPRPRPRRAEGVRPGVDIGTRPTFADLGQTVADVFGVGPLANGTSFLRDILK